MEGGRPVGTDGYDYAYRMTVDDRAFYLPLLKSLDGFFCSFPNSGDCSSRD